MQKRFSLTFRKTNFLTCQTLYPKYLAGASSWFAWLEVEHQNGKCVKRFYWLALGSGGQILWPRK